MNKLSDKLRNKINQYLQTRRIIECPKEQCSLLKEKEQKRYINEFWEEYKDFDASWSLLTKIEQEVLARCYMLPPWKKRLCDAIDAIAVRHKRSGRAIDHIRFCAMMKLDTALEMSKKKREGSTPCSQDKSGVPVAPVDPNKSDTPDYPDTPCSKCVAEDEAAEKMEVEKAAARRAAASVPTAKPSSVPTAKVVEGPHPAQPPTPPPSTPSPASLDQKLPNVCMGKVVTATVNVKTPPNSPITQEEEATIKRLIQLLMKEKHDALEIRISRA